MIESLEGTVHEVTILQRMRHKNIHLDLFGARSKSFSHLELSIILWMFCINEFTSYYTFCYFRKVILKRTLKNKLRTNVFIIDIFANIKPFLKMWSLINNIELNDCNMAQTFSMCFAELLNENICFKLF